MGMRVNEVATRQATTHVPVTDVVTGYHSMRSIASTNVRITDRHREI